MTASDLVDQLEPAEDFDIEAHPRAFGITPKMIDSAERRLQAWAEACPSAANVYSVDDVSYSWDAHPRRLHNGALQGRVYAQPRGGIPRDIGGYKIAGDGTVLKIPAALRAVLPGATGAAASDDEAQP